MVKAAEKVKECTGKNGIQIFFFLVLLCCCLFDFLREIVLVELTKKL